MDVPMFVWGIFFLCILFWVFVFTNRKQILLRMHRSLVTANIQKFKNIRKQYDTLATSNQSIENLVQQLQRLRLAIEKNIENLTIIVEADPAFKDRTANKVYITAIEKSSKQLKRITHLAENFESFISKRHAVQQK
jgi:cell fate (sporulation/competence/biofilm development) regulator YlbF (YheA/YmcA/DUF963 family)